MKTIYIKRYDLVYSGGKFYIKNGKEQYILNATNWDEAEKEAETYKEQLKKQNPNCVVVID